MGEEAEEAGTPPRTRQRVFALYAVFTAATVAGFLAARWGHGAGLGDGGIAVGSFASVIAASLLISWAGEAGQFLISQGLIVAIIALLQVLPEFMIEAVLAWKGDTPNMLANLTGSNRLLMGLGWPLIYVTAMVAHGWRTRRLLGPIELRPENCIEVWALVISSGYFLVILWRGTLIFWDGIVLLLMFAVYVWGLSRLPAEEEGRDELLAPSVVLVEMPRRRTIAAITTILLIGGAAMVLVAEPFVESMKSVAAAWGISQFYFLQWVAPFLTEFPEKVTAFYWARRVTLAPMALLNVISSKVNQWTLLAGMVPIIYCLRGVLSPDGRGHFLDRVVPVQEHAIEVWLSLAMTMYGAACLLKRRFTGVNCLILFTLWFVQFVSPPPSSFVGHDVRKLTAIIFAALTPIELLWNARTMTPLQDLRELWRLMRFRTPAPRSTPGTGGAPGSGPT